MEPSRVDKALQNRHKRKYDCCQSVLLAYNDLIGVPDRQAYSIAGNYGSAVGVEGIWDSYEGVILFRYMHVGCGYTFNDIFSNCGALVAALLVCTIKENPLIGNVSEKIVEPSELAPIIEEKFAERFGGEKRCGWLSGSRTGGKRIAPCDEIIRYACKLVEDMVFPGMFEPFEM